MYPDTEGSIVTYYINEDIFPLLDSFLIAAQKIPSLKYEVVIIENGNKEKTDIHLQVEEKYPFASVTILGENLGYGRAHNLTIDAGFDYHLVLNPDIEFFPDSLLTALEFMENNEQCGLLSPQCYWRNGDRQYLCKRYPDVSVLLIRAFAPKAIQSIFRKKLEYYCMKEELQAENILLNPPIVTGCFMLFRTKVLTSLGGFDKDFFLYFEDTDLSLRARKITDVAYVPGVKVLHHGGNVSKKGLKHILFFTSSMIKFFRKHGWRFV
ncbi:N-acetylglucosaminyl-diphospho-decaprenol L-rhamnosyltransferase [Klebsiella spallanzanii]|nr:N-acetylglucosaminyl-diphospho-decaprenol L-rhamnosyltransferase [Klebsiella spallanzanii]